MERSLHETGLSSSHLMLQKDKFKTHSILSNLQSTIWHGEANAWHHHETEMVCNSHINAEIKQFWACDRLTLISSKTALLWTCVDGILHFLDIDRSVLVWITENFSIHLNPLIYTGTFFSIKYLSRKEMHSASTMSPAQQYQTSPHLFFPAPSSGLSVPHSAPGSSYSAYTSPGSKTSFPGSGHFLSETVPLLPLR